MCKKLLITPFLLLTSCFVWPEEDTNQLFSESIWQDERSHHSLILMEKYFSENPKSAYLYNEYLATERISREYRRMGESESRINEEQMKVLKEASEETKDSIVRKLLRRIKPIGRITAGAAGGAVGGMPGAVIGGAVGLGTDGPSLEEMFAPDREFELPSFAHETVENPNTGQKEPLPYHLARHYTQTIFSCENSACPFDTNEAGIFVYSELKKDKAFPEIESIDEQGNRHFKSADEHGKKNPLIGSAVTALSTARKIQEAVRQENQETQEVVRQEKQETQAVVRQESQATQEVARQESQATQEVVRQESQETQEAVHQGNKQVVEVLNNQLVALSQKMQEIPEEEKQRLEDLHQQQATEYGDLMGLDPEDRERQIKIKKAKENREIIQSREQKQKGDNTRIYNLNNEIKRLEEEQKISDFQKPLSDVQDWARAVNVMGRLFNAPPPLIKASQATIVGLEISKSIGSMIIKGALDPTGITAVLTGVSLFVQLFEDAGPTPDQIIIDNLQVIQANQAQMLEMLGKIDSKIDGLQKSINDLKNILERNHAEVMGKLHEIHEELRQIGHRLYNIESTLREDRQREFKRRTYEARFYDLFHTITDQPDLIERYAYCKNKYILGESVSSVFLKSEGCVSECVFQKALQQDLDFANECFNQCTNIEEGECDQLCRHSLNTMVKDKVKNTIELEDCVRGVHDDHLSKLEEHLLGIYTDAMGDKEGRGGLHTSDFTITNHTQIYNDNNIKDSFKTSTDPSQRVSQLPDIFKILYNSAKKLTTPNDEDEISRTEAMGKVVEDLNNNTTLLKHPVELDSRFLDYVKVLKKFPHPRDLSALEIDREEIYKSYQTEFLGEMCHAVKYIEGVSEYSRQHIENALYIYSSYLKVLHRGIISSVTKTINKLGKLDRDYTPNDKKYENHKSAIMHFLSQKDYLPNAYKEPERVSNHLLRSRTHLARRVDSRLTDQDEEELMNRGFQKEIDRKDVCRTYEKSGDEIRYAEIENEQQLKFLKDTLTALQSENPPQGGCWFNDTKGVITGHPGTKMQLYQKQTRTNDRGEVIEGFLPMCAVVIFEIIKYRALFVDWFEPTRRSICSETDLGFLHTERTDHIFPKFFSDDQIYYLTEHEKEEGLKPQPLHFHMYFTQVMNIFLNDDQVPQSDKTKMFNKYALLVLTNWFSQETNINIEYNNQNPNEFMEDQVNQLFHIHMIGPPPPRNYFNIFYKADTLWPFYRLGLVYGLSGIPRKGIHSREHGNDRIRDFIKSNNIDIYSLIKFIINSIQIPQSYYTDSTQDRLAKLAQIIIDQKSPSYELAQYKYNNAEKLIRDVINFYYKDANILKNTMKIDNKDNRKNIGEQQWVATEEKNTDSYGSCRQFACLATQETPQFVFYKDKWQEVAQTELLNHIETIKEELSDNKKFKALLTDARKVHFGLSTLIRFGYGDERLHNDPQLVELKNLLIYLENFTDMLLSKDTGEQWRAIYNLNRHFQNLLQTVKEMGGNHLESIIPNVPPQEYGIGQLGIRKQAFDIISKNEHWNVKECSYP